MAIFNSYVSSPEDTWWYHLPRWIGYWLGPLGYVYEVRSHPWENVWISRHERPVILRGYWGEDLQSFGNVRADREAKPDPGNPWCFFGWMSCYQSSAFFAQGCVLVVLVLPKLLRTHFLDALFLPNPGLHGSSWVFMGLHGSSWVFMGLHGSSWVFMGLHGSSWVNWTR